MTRLTSLIQHPRNKPLGALVLALLLAGCAQQSMPNYYSTSHDSTEADAQNQAQGRSGARAPSQIQLGFGADQKVDKPQTQQEDASERAVLKARPLAEAKTFLGTIPCLTGGTTCSAQRLTLTLAPSGEWRSRSVRLHTHPAKHTIFLPGFLGLFEIG